jgi:hypothetical protein
MTEVFRDFPESAEAGESFHALSNFLFIFPFDALQSQLLTASLNK